MSHLSPGTLRRMLDQPQSTRADLTAHLAGCARCRERAERMVADARRAAVLVDGPPKPHVDAPAALAKLRLAGLDPLGAPARARSWTAGWARRRRILRPVVAVALVGLLGLVLVGTGVAGNLIKIFEPERVVAVPVDGATLSSLPDLAGYGRLQVLQEPEPAEVADLEEAATATGLALLAAPPPPGTGAERIFAASRGTVSFTFDAALAESAAGELPASLAALDGRSLILQAGPAVVQVFGEPAAADRDRAGRGDLAGLLSALPDLMIVQMKAPVISSDGPSVAEFREALLDLPGLPPTLARQIEAIGDASSTLPLPIPIDLARAEEVDVNGAPGLLVGDNTGVGSGVVWQSGGLIRAVGGQLREAEVLALARALR